MSDTIIKVENLSKRYRIGLQEKKADTFAQQMWNNIKAPVENFKRIKSLGKFEEDSESVHWALKDVSFEVKQGEVLGIIGKNGAGKSTLLKTLSKITEPTSGRIEMNGRVAALLEVGTGFHPELTGRENIYMNGTILGMTKKEIDRKLDEIIDFSGVEKYVDTPVKFYSSGMRVRLGFSVAAHLEPEILIIDEVLAVGDYEFQQKCLGKMEDVSLKDGRTVLFVSHQMGAVQKLCNKSVILNNGILDYSGITSDCIERYLNYGNRINFYNKDKESDKNEFWIETISLKNEFGELASSFNHDGPIYISANVGYKKELSGVYILITILDSKENKIFSAERLIDKTEFILRINSNFLTRGNYNIQSIIYKPGVSQFEIIKNACGFSIYDAGSSFSHLETFDYGNVFGDYNWIG